MSLSTPLARPLLAGLLAAAGGLAGAAPAAPDVATDEEVRNAFLYAYPYFEFMKLRRRALYDAAGPTHTTLNRLRHQRMLTTPNDRWANGPINDAFYSTTWLDLAAGPVVLDLPNTADRYYVVVLIAADTDSFAYFGRRNGGTGARRVAIVGPGWEGALPQADEVVRAPTRDVYVNMRVRVDGPEDMARVNALQDRFSFRPVRPAAIADEPREVPADGDAARFVAVVNEALARNPPPASEASLLARYRKVGICGEACSWDRLPTAIQARWREVMPAAITRLKSALSADRHDVERQNGWRTFRLPHRWGTNYAQRAGSAANSGGVFGVEAAEATYFSASIDAGGDALGDGRRYRLRLPAGGLPADAFWSISLYEFQPEGQYLLHNPINRYFISDRTPGLRRNADGSVDIWIQPADPGPDLVSNWLPSPAGNRFYLMARLYQPRAEVLDGAWVPPPVVHVHE